MTTKLYEEDGYGTEFDSTVVSCCEIQKDGTKIYQVILEETLFFPEEGGQSPDKGKINGIEVMDVQIDKQDVITHTLTTAVESGSLVHGSIDWNHRYNNMQQHSGEHIFSGLVHEKFGYNNVGFHLSDQIVTMDFDGMLEETDVRTIEKKANEAVVKNIDIEVLYPSKEELKELDYRSKIEIEGQVRLVKIPGVDLCACCAPHVKKTGEIGIIKVMNCQKYKSGVRLSILCGFRALADYNDKIDVMGKLGNLLSANQDTLYDTIVKMKQTNQDMKAELSKAKQELLENKLADVDPAQENVILFEGEMDNHIIRNVVNQLMEEHTGICGIFAGNDSSGYTFVAGSQSVDMKEIATKLREELGCKGGGNQAMIQGSVVATKEDIEKLIL